MKKIIVQMYAVITAIALIHGTCVVAAQEQYQPNLLLSKEMAQALGEYAISGVTKYLNKDPRLEGVIMYLEEFITPDEAVKIAVSYVIDAIKKDNAFLATQMLGALLNDLNNAYGTTFQTNKILTDITRVQQPPTAPVIVPPAAPSEQTVPSPTDYRKTAQEWTTAMWKNIQYYIDRGYQMGQDVIAASKELWNKWNRKKTSDF